MAYNKRKHLEDNIAALRAEFDSHGFGGLEDAATNRAKADMRKFTGFGGLKCVLYPVDADRDIDK